MEEDDLTFYGVNMVCSYISVMFSLMYISFAQHLKWVEVMLILTYAAGLCHNLFQSNKRPIQFMLLSVVKWIVLITLSMHSYLEILSIPILGDWWIILMCMCRSNNDLGIFTPPNYSLILTIVVNEIVYCIIGIAERDLGFLNFIYLSMIYKFCLVSIINYMDWSPNIMRLVWVMLPPLITPYINKEYPEDIFTWFGGLLLLNILVLIYELIF